MAYVGLFLASYVWVFLQGFQSRSVNSGEYVWAFFGSFLLGTAQAYVLSRVILSNDPTHLLVYCLGGACGIVSAMRYFAFLKTKKDSTTNDHQDHQSGFDRADRRRNQCCCRSDCSR